MWCRRGAEREDFLGFSYALKKTRFSKDGTLLTFGIESPLLKEEVTARLKRKGIFADAAFSRELVKLPVEAFVTSPSPQARPGRMASPKG